jgi:hypothetical protein
LPAHPGFFSVVSTTAQEVQALSQHTSLNLYNEAVNTAYLQFGLNPSNGNALAMYTTSLQSLNDAIAQQQLGAITLTEPQISVINAQVDVVQGRANELVRGSAQVGVTTPSQQITGQAETFVSALQVLPPDVKVKIGYEAAFNALLSAQMDGSNVELAQAALDKARAGVEAALEMDGLDAGTREMLQAMLDDIDSVEGTEDNEVDVRAQSAVETAKASQGNAVYNGVDIWEPDTLQKGKIYYRGEPNGNWLFYNKRSY